MEMNNENAVAAIEALRAVIGGGQIDAAAVERIAGALMDKKFAAALPALLEQCGKIAGAAAKTAAEQVQAAAVRTLKFQASPDRPPVDLGVQHKNFETLLKLCDVRGVDGNRLNIYLYGPAGTGKTTAAANVARAIYGDDWANHFYANGALMSKYELLGFRDAAGVYHETQFYKAYKYGGVYLFDELDDSNAAAMVAFNKALANGHENFEGEMVRRHPDCIVIAGGNTCMRGDGAGAGFQRVRMDSAFRDRFVFLDWPIDEKLEMAIAGGYGDVGRAWCAKVQAWRKNAAAAGIRDFEITPRATYFGISELAKGLPESVVIDSCVRKGLPSAQWEKVNG